MAEAGIHLLLDTVDNADAQYQQQKQYFVASMQALVRFLRVPVPVPLSPLPPQTRGRKRAQRTTKQPKQERQPDGKENLDPEPERPKLETLLAGCDKLGVCAEGAAEELVDQEEPASSKAEALTAQFPAATCVCDDKILEDDDKVNYDKIELSDEKRDGYGQIDDRDGKLESEPAAGCGENGVEKNETETSAHFASGYEENERKSGGDFRAEPSQQLIIDDSLDDRQKSGNQEAEAGVSPDISLQEAGQVDGDPEEQSNPEERKSGGYFRAEPSQQLIIDDSLDDRQKSGNQEAEAEASLDISLQEAGQVDVYPEEQGNHNCEPIDAKTEGEASFVEAYFSETASAEEAGFEEAAFAEDTLYEEGFEETLATVPEDDREESLTTDGEAGRETAAAATALPEATEPERIASCGAKIPEFQKFAEPLSTAATSFPGSPENSRASDQVASYEKDPTHLPAFAGPASPRVSTEAPTSREVPDTPQRDLLENPMALSEALPTTSGRVAEVPDESSAPQEPEVSENLKASASVNLVSSMRSFLPLVVQQQPAIPYANGKKEVRVKALEAAEAARKQEEKRAEERKARKLELQKREISQDLSGVSTRTKRPLEHKIKLEQKTRKLEEEQKRKEEEWKKKELELHAKKRKKEEVDKRDREDKRRKVDDVNRMRREQEDKLRAELEEKEQRRKILEEAERERKALEEEIKKQKRLEKEKEIERRRKAEEEAKANWLANKEADRKRKEAYQRMKMLEKEQQRPVEKNPVVVSTINQQDLQEVQRERSLGLVGQPMRVPKEPSGQRKAVSLSTVKTNFNPKFSMNGTESYLGTPAVKTSLDHRRQLYCTPLMGSDLDEDEEDDDGPMSYEISPYRCSDDEDEETEIRPHKPIPRWASKDRLMARLARQAHIDPDKIFIGASSCSLNEVFGTTGNKKRKDFKERSGSGDWLQDMVTWKEELLYKRSMGYL